MTNTLLLIAGDGIGIEITARHAGQRQCDTAYKNIRFYSHSDRSGRADGVQIMMHRDCAYASHGFSNAITTADKARFGRSA